MTTTDYTPALPLRVNDWENGEASINDANGAALHLETFNLEDARYIVRACNAYPKLLAACKAAQQFIAHSKFIDCGDDIIGEDAITDLEQQLRTAIDEAENE